MAQLTPLLVSLLTVVALLTPEVVSTNFTIVNKCEYTVWPGVFSTANGNLTTTGFALEKGATKTLEAPPSWGGRFWGRTLCSHNNSTGNFSCVTGDCGSSKLACSGNVPTQPATIAEFQLDVSDSIDYYDVSLVNGYNLPISVVSRSSEGSNCTTTNCVVNDVNDLCPAELKFTTRVNGSSQGQVVACESACAAFGEPQYCCSGAYSSPETCKPTNYSQMFKKACPQAYTYKFDSMFSCVAGDYTITFCPTPNASTSQDILKPSKSISSNQSLTSSLGTFALGFFSPQNSTKYFLEVY